MEWSFTFDKPGEWKYHDHQNPYLKGEVIVDPGASDGGDGGDSEASGFFASIGALLSNAYGAVLSALAPEGEEPVSADADEATASGADTGELSGEQFAEVRDLYMTLARDEDPKAALDLLRDESETDDALSRSCHAIVHEIGHAAYMKYGDFSEAMKYQDEICNSGYIHGIIESRFAESDDVFTDMKTLCDQYSLGSFLS